jgi:[ribosomal protein S18]-alanine N-acetyltransferase
VTRRLEPVSRTLAGPLSLLQRACFPRDPWDAAAIAEIMGIAGFFGRIAWEETEPAGFALAYSVGGQCEILSLGVVVERRRSGIGSALLDAVCSEARRRGAEGIVLEVAVDNTAARALYATRGFDSVARRRNYYRREDGSVDALVLRLALASLAI